MKDITTAINAIEEFDDRCESAQHTDTGEAWALLNELKDFLMTLKAGHQRNLDRHA